MIQWMRGRVERKFNGQGGDSLREHVDRFFPPSCSTAQQVIKKIAALKSALLLQRGREETKKQVVYSTLLLLLLPPFKSQLLRIPVLHPTCTPFLSCLVLSLSLSCDPLLFLSASHISSCRAAWSSENSYSHHTCVGVHAERREREVMGRSSGLTSFFVLLVSLHSLRSHSVSHFLRCRWSSPAVRSGSLKWYFKDTSSSQTQAIVFLSLSLAR